MRVPPGVRFIEALLATAVVACVSAGTVFAASRPVAQTDVLRGATGTITSLDLSQLTVGHMSCRFGTKKIADLAGNFAVGENVTIGCLGHSLETIVLRPITTGPAHPDSIVVHLQMPAPPTYNRSGSPSGSAVSNGAVYGASLTWGAIAMGGSLTPTGSVDVSGAISSVTTGSSGVPFPASILSVTVNGQTCTLPTFSNAPMNAYAAVQVGSTAQMACTLYSNGLSAGSLKVSPSSGG